MSTRCTHTVVSYSRLRGENGGRRPKWCDRVKPGCRYRCGSHIRRGHCTWRDATIGEVGKRTQYIWSSRRSVYSTAGQGSFTEVAMARPT
ncbi:hypothetical protein C8Q73DRAFT_417896 [Cubamyces lactineus]|nr:hypothetical protein C8Q73DRAFT_417896 [Cubamyces lactineus]